jgi:hypothetical protein
MRTVSQKDLGKSLKMKKRVRYPYIIDRKRYFTTKIMQAVMVMKSTTMRNMAMKKNNKKKMLNLLRNSYQSSLTSFTATRRTP